MKTRILPFLGTAAVLVLAACGGADKENAPATDTTSVAAPSAADTTAPAPGTAAASGMFLDPNTATAQELLMVPGFDQSLADAVVQGRPYADMTAVDKVLAPRLSEAQRDTAYGRLWKPINLNTASREEILLVPGVGPRMAHEFEEYRPYTSIEQFRREIGKYVDEAEVARLERFVTIN
ncbi:MAG TPA: helix-hairpin-helix domain-containing protein [Longimicrobium sp.]|nr:helix-hairpin-helix domain-containing protein [Longimicrobium sp.]